MMIIFVMEQIEVENSDFANSNTGTWKKRIDVQIKTQRDGLQELRDTSAKERVSKLKQLEAYILSHRDELKKALHDDFKKPGAEVDMSEIYASLMELRHTIRHLKKWMAPKKVGAPLAIAATRSHIRYEPKGLVLIISPWNFPFVLTVSPLISAIAAGNSVIIKPSELSPHTSKFLQHMVDSLFADHEVSLFQGDKEVAQHLLSKRFDHIFFTGSPRVGKIVMKAAAEHLTSVTLELGGKSPAIVDATAGDHLEDAVDKIIWGKFVNAGQTCIAPDYVLVHEHLEEHFLALLKKKLEQIYQTEITTKEQSDHYASIVNTNHFNRLKCLLDDATAAGSRVVTGGHCDCDEQQRFIAPTVLANVTKDSPLMQEEIFGPLLPVLTYSSKKEAVEMINRRPNPLALYLFSSDKKATNYFLNHTSAGGSCVNETLLQFMHTRLPFGGAGNSGIGKSHGIYGFRAFSNERPVLRSSIRFSPTKVFYPPYTAKVRKMIDWLIRFF